MKHQEIKTVEHKGIKVMLKVDYDSGLVSLVERGMEFGKYKKMEWVFAERGLEFMNSWLNILEVMSFAIKEGKKCLEQDLS